MIPKRLSFLIAAIITFSTLLKLYYAYICSSYIWGDTGVIGSIAKQILKGEFPLFFYGHFYMGALESWIIAFFFFLFGVSSYTIHLGPIFASCLFLISTYFLGKELKDYRTGIIALIYCAIPPFYLFKQGVIPLGYHIEMLFFGNIIFIIALRKRITLALFGLLGLISGLAFWNTYLIVYYLVAAWIFIIIRLHRPWQIFLGGIIFLFFFFLGGLHFWIFNLTHDFASFKFHPMTSLGFLILFKRIITYHVTGILGLKNIFLVGLYCYSGIFFIFSKTHKKWLFIIFIITMIFFLTRSEYYAFCMDYRYVLPIFSALPFMIALTRPSIFYFLILINSLQILRGIPLDREEFKRDGVVSNELINFFDAHKIKGVYGKFNEVGIINFIGGDRIHAAEILNSSAPFDTEVLASDRTAYMDMDNFKPFFDMLCKSYKVKRIDEHRIFYDIQPWDYYGEEMSPSSWKAISNYNPEWSSWAFDRNLDRYWSSITPKKTGMYFQIEFEKVYKIYKFQIFNLPGDDAHLPEGYRILASIDGMDWRLVGESNMVHPMFWSGPNIFYSVKDTRWEVIFAPIEARFIRIEQIGESRYPWEINEILFYEYKRDRPFRLRDYVKDAWDVYQFILKKGIRFVYADYWLSAKIKSWSKVGIGVLGIYNECWPDRENTSRLMELDKGRAIIVERPNEKATEEILNGYGLSFEKKVFGEYICYYLNVRRPVSNILYWTGPGMCRINLRGFGKFLAEDGRYKNAIKYFPSNPYLYKGDLSRKEKEFVRHRFTPKVKRHARFSNGIEFLGLGIDKLQRISYFWRLERNLEEKVFVFVHFIKDGRIVFQNDHPLLEQFVRLPVLQPEEIWKETYIIRIPKDKYTVRIGLANKKDFVEIDIDAT